MIMIFFYLHRCIIGGPRVHNLPHLQASALPVRRDRLLHPRGGPVAAGRLLSLRPKRTR